MVLLLLLLLLLHERFTIKVFITWGSLSADQDHRRGPAAVSSAD